MARFLDIAAPVPAQLRLRPGDVVRFDATGGRVERGDGIVEALGGFGPGVVGLDGDVVAPESGPTSYLLRAVRPGRAEIIIFTTRGGFEPADQHRLEIVVGD
jgi:hypothetical protein